MRNVDHLVDNINMPAPYLDFNTVFLTPSIVMNSEDLTKACMLYAAYHKLCKHAKITCQKRDEYWLKLVKYFGDTSFINHKNPSEELSPNDRIALMYAIYFRVQDDLLTDDELTKLQLIWSVTKKEDLKVVSEHSTSTATPFISKYIWNTWEYVGHLLLGNQQEARVPQVFSRMFENLICLCNLAQSKMTNNIVTVLLCSHVLGNANIAKRLQKKYGDDIYLKTLLYDLTGRLDLKREIVDELKSKRKCALKAKANKNTQMFHNLCIRWVYTYAFVL